MIAAELYEKTLDEYLSLQPSSRQSLSRYCKERRVNYSSFKYWMKKNSLSVPCASRSSRRSESSFIPISVLPAERGGHTVAPIACIVKGVKISLRNGMRITLDEISGKDMIEINCIDLLFGLYFLYIMITTPLTIPKTSLDKSCRLQFHIYQ